MARGCCRDRAGRLHPRQKDPALHADQTTRNCGHLPSFELQKCLFWKEPSSPLSWARSQNKPELCRWPPPYRHPRCRTAGVLPPSHPGLLQGAQSTLPPLPAPPPQPCSFSRYCFLSRGEARASLPRCLVFYLLCVPLQDPPGDQGGPLRSDLRQYPLIHTHPMGLRMNLKEKRSQELC